MTIEAFVIGAAAAGDSAAARSLFSYLRDAGWVGVVILMLSLTAIALIVAQFFRVRLERLAPRETVQQLESLMSSGRTEETIAFCAAEGSPIARIVGTALARCQRSTFGLLELSTALEDAGQHEIARLYRETDWLGLIASVAPMLGLLGTVLGMVGAFDVLGAGQGPVRPGELAGSISMALITTVLGLIVAIPCTAAYTYFRNRIDQFADDMALVVAGLSAALEGSRRGARRTDPAPAPAGMG